MIILKHLTVERFRLLRELNLHFPQRGSILIQGPNESGKSALLECIYFALYGESLAADRGKRSLDDLILYGASSAVVTLTFSVSATEFTVRRTLERGQGQQVTLYVRHLGTPEAEPVTDLDTANEQIIAALGNMDGRALRDSCLIEQKRLDHLETLPAVEREKTVRKLLGLEKFALLAKRFSVTPDDELSLKTSSDRLRLAEIQARIPKLSKKLDDLEAALDAVKVHEDLEEISRQDAEITELEQTLQHIEEQRLELNNRRARAQQLRNADETLAEIIAAYEEIAKAQRVLPDLERQISALERREREDLPGLEKRVSELGELMRSFGTLQRMSNDLLTSVETLKELEQELKQQDEARDDLKSLDEQVAHTRGRLEEAQQSLEKLEERRRAGRPHLEARLQRMKILSERMKVLKQAEEQYTRSQAVGEQADEHITQLNKTRKSLRDAGYELEQAETEAQQTQQQIATLDRTWRQLNVGQQIEEWCHQKELVQELSQIEQHLMLTRQHQATLTQGVMNARSSATKYMGLFVVCLVLALLGLSVAIVEVLQHATLFAIFAGVAFILLCIGMSSSYYKYSKARKEEKDIYKQEQEAINLVGSMVASRDAVIRKGASQETLTQLEQEIRLLNGSLPSSIEEAKQMLQPTPEQSERITETQQQLKARRDELSAVYARINALKETTASLQREQNQLEETRKKSGWSNIEEDLRNDLAAVERMHQEITLLAGQEGLPLPSINARLQKGPVALNPLVRDEDAIEVPELEVLVESTLKATEREIEAIDGKLDLVADLNEQIRVHQEALDVFLARQRVLAERNERYQTSNPALQLERAREQQSALRQALQSLQDSLRQRVKPLEVAFGQAAVSNAETVARKQLEELQITLGNKVMLQEQHARATQSLKERQEELSDHYKQLSKFSNTLGSWIVPLNPFAGALVSLRNRCQREIEELNEVGSLQELETLKNREGAAKAKMALCRQEIEDIRERISFMLTRRNRPAPKNYELDALTAVWPLLEEFTIKDRDRLDEERNSVDQELTALEEQDMALSAELQTGNVPLDLEQEQLYAERLERSYLAKKHGSELLKAVDQRLMLKMGPRTEYYMQQILRLLTGGRYHDVHLSTESEAEASHEGAFQVSVWDAAAGEYVSRSALSAGAADQLSLALRLAFAIAALPRELSAAPGFVLLDEPLSSFDRGRAQALVDVITGELMSQHFEQILLISHSSAFDPAMFPYHVYMDNGLVVESNLPVVQPLPLTDVSSKDEPAEDAALVPALSQVKSE
ncbi:MAG TPA: AAA family ATPase [Ktedonobacteraceae bacterium]|nr:AAA family ATPase [Ktedonobacteraceae bacterium]